MQPASLARNTVKNTIHSASSELFLSLGVKLVPNLTGKTGTEQCTLACVRIPMHVETTHSPNKQPLRLTASLTAATQQQLNDKTSCLPSSQQLLH
jgi:hypothetical protein